MKDGSSPPAPDTVLGLIVLRIVRRYLDERVTAATGDDPREFRRTKKPQHSKMLEVRQHQAQSLFMELRSRREADFMNLFRSKLLPCGQWLKDDDVLRLQEALFDADENEKVKTLTLLALSANSYVPAKKETAP